MDCFCGCGRAVPRHLVDANLQAAVVAVELLAWDKARAAGHLDGAGVGRAELIIERGTLSYRHLLESVHGEARHSTEEAATWLREAALERRQRPYMIRKAGPFGRDKLLLTQPDYDRLDKLHPERSFSGTPTEGGKVIDDLERLTSLHDSGALTTAEFIAAKTLLLGGR